MPVTYLKTTRGGHFESTRGGWRKILALTESTCCAPTLPTLSVALAYRQLWRVEQIFRTAKSILETRPIFHQCNAAIVGHLFCSFLALLLRKDLDDRLAALGTNPEWADIVRELDRVEEVTVVQPDKRFL
ncbi:MAG: hypothetical protein J2P48_21255, partial [Alphaproteobacteria bacterium]|nr:hypothetical protein [Alphaproteobacteria bacterium]